MGHAAAGHSWRRGKEGRQRCAGERGRGCRRPGVLRDRPVDSPGEQTDGKERKRGRGGRGARRACRQSPDADGRRDGRTERRGFQRRGRGSCLGEFRGLEDGCREACRERTGQSLPAAAPCGKVRHGRRGLSFCGTRSRACGTCARMRVRPQHGHWIRTGRPCVRLSFVACAVGGRRSEADVRVYPGGQRRNRQRRRVGHDFALLREHHGGNHGACRRRGRTQTAPCASGVEHALFGRERGLRSCVRVCLRGKKRRLSGPWSRVQQIHRRTR